MDMGDLIFFSYSIFLPDLECLDPWTDLDSVHVVQRSGGLGRIWFLRVWSCLPEAARVNRTVISAPALFEQDWNEAVKSCDLGACTIGNWPQIGQQVLP